MTFPLRLIQMDLFSDSNMSGILGDVEDTPRHPPPKTILEQGQAVSTDSTSSLTLVVT